MVRLLFATEVGDGYESITYFDGQGRRASLANERGLTHLRLPDEAPATLELVAQHFGDSVLKSCDLDIELHPDLALVLAVAVDAQHGDVKIRIVVPQVKDLALSVKEEAEICCLKIVFGLCG